MINLDQSLLLLEDYSFFSSILIFLTSESLENCVIVREEFFNAHLKKEQ